MTAIDIKDAIAAVGVVLLGAGLAFEFSLAIAAAGVGLALYGLALVSSVPRRQ